MRGWGDRRASLPLILDKPKRSEGAIQDPGPHLRWTELGPGFRRDERVEGIPPKNPLLPSPSLAYVPMMFHSALIMSADIQIVLTLIGGYLLGSIPFGLIAARLGGAGDIRAIGSGSIGATNVLRTGRRELALITLIGDGGKGAVAALAAGALFGPIYAVLAGGAAFVGHLFPVWLGFKGGKGIATAAGVLLAIVWPVGLAAGATWLIMALVFRISSLASLTVAVLTPIWFLVLSPNKPGVLILLLLMAVLTIIRHGANIRRLLAGEEPRIGAAKTSPAL